MQLLDRINRTGTTVVVATHDEALVDWMRRRVIELDHGALVRDQARGVYGIEEHGPTATRRARRRCRLMPVSTDYVARETALEPVAQPPDDDRRHADGGGLAVAGRRRPACSSRAPPRPRSSGSVAPRSPSGWTRQPPTPRSRRSERSSRTPRLRRPVCVYRTARTGTTTRPRRTSARPPSRAVLAASKTSDVVPLHAGAAPATPSSSSTGSAANRVSQP